MGILDPTLVLEHTDLWCYHWCTQKNRANKGSMYGFDPCHLMFMRPLPSPIKQLMNACRLAAALSGHHALDSSACCVCCSAHTQLTHLTGHVEPCMMKETW